MDPPRLEAGDFAPNFQLPDEKGKPFILRADQVAGRPVLLCFSPPEPSAATLTALREAAAELKDLGAVAIDGGRWEIYLGGAAGSTVRKGDLLCTVDTQDEVLKYMGRFIQYYRENGKYLERSYGFVERLGIGHP